jgi:hypothetical protein
MLVPKVQLGYPIAGPQVTAVGEHELPMRMGDLNAENAGRVRGIFDDLEMVPQLDVEHKKGPGQPGMAVRGRQAVLCGTSHTRLFAL